MVNRKIPTRVTGYIEVKDPISATRLHNKYSQHEMGHWFTSGLKAAVPATRFEIDYELLKDGEQDFLTAVKEDITAGELTFQDENASESVKYRFENGDWEKLKGLTVFYANGADFTEQLPMVLRWDVYGYLQKRADLTDIDELIEEHAVVDEAIVLSDSDKEDIQSNFRDNLEWDQSPYSRLVGEIEDYLRDPVNADPDKVYTIHYLDADGNAASKDFTGITTLFELGQKWVDLTENEGAEQFGQYTVRPFEQADIKSEEAFGVFVKAHIGEYLPEDWKGSKITVTKVQAINSSYVAITVAKPSEQSAPAIDLTPFYQDYNDGAPVPELLQKIADVVTGIPGPDAVSFETFDSWDKVKDNVFMRLCSATKNYEMLKNVPHRSLAEGLAITYHIPITKTDGDMAGITIITNDLARKYGVWEEMLYDTATSNKTPFTEEVMGSIGDFISGLSGTAMPNGPQALYVLTNKANTFGSSVMAMPGVLKAAADKLGENFYVLPSSIHEVLLLGESAVKSVCAISDMVMQINRNVVNTRDFLSDNIYYYDRGTDAVDIVYL